MKTIRYGVFETNSSSMHSLSIRLPNRKKLNTFNKDYSFELFDEEGYVIIKMGRYGWGTGSREDDVLWRQYDKLCYLLTLVKECEMRDGNYTYLHTYKSKDISPSALLKRTDGFKTLDSWIASKRSNRKGISPTYNWDNFEFKEYGEHNCDNEYKYYTNHEYYVDHQSSVDEYKNLRDFLEKNEMTLDEIILNPRVFIDIDNDNH